MSLYIIAFLIPALVWIVIAKLFLNYNFSIGEVIVQIVITLIFISGLFAAGSYSQTVDVMFVNGAVERLEPRKRDCPWGWNDYTDSHCTKYHTRRVPDGETCTGTGKDRTCRTNYKTQYNYYYDWERRYYAHSDIDTFEIKRVDDQGVNTPPRFAQIEIGDPVTMQQSFTNYIRGASASLFLDEPQGDDVVVAYPKVHDYYKANRVIVQGVPFDSGVWRDWNEDLMKVNTAVAKTGANVIVVITNSNPSFADMLARAWESHNINDVVVTIGTDGSNVKWADVNSWSKNKMVEIEIRDGILDAGTLDHVAIDAIIENAVADHFELQSMDEFEYLAAEIIPPTPVLYLAWIFLLLATPTITYVFNKYDVIK